MCRTEWMWHGQEIGEEQIFQFPWQRRSTHPLEHAISLNRCPVPFWKTKYDFVFINIDMNMDMNMLSEMSITLSTMQIEFSQNDPHRLSKPVNGIKNVIWYSKYECGWYCPYPCHRCWQRTGNVTTHSDSFQNSMRGQGTCSTSYNQISIQNYNKTFFLHRNWPLIVLQNACSVSHNW